MTLVLLQNAWSRWYTRIGLPDEPWKGMRAKVWQREDWIEATWASRSGQRLKTILAGVPEDQIWLDDTTLEISEKSSGLLKPDLEHVSDVLLERGITSVVACGNQAGDVAAELWHGPAVYIPHPAHRTFSNAACKKCNRRIKCMLDYLAAGRCYTAWVDTYGQEKDLVP